MNRGWCALAVWSGLASAAWGLEESSVSLPVPPAPAAPAAPAVPALTPPEEVFTDGAGPVEPMNRAEPTDRLEPAKPPEGPKPPPAAEPAESGTRISIRIGPDDDDVWPKPPEFSTTRWWPAPGEMTWLVGRRDRFGIFSLTGGGAMKLDSWPGLSLTSGYGFHFFDGPVRTDLPSKVFDFHWGLHWGGAPADGWYADLAFTAGVYSDFEDSARDGWRFPSHAVLFYELTPELHPVLGVKHFDRQNLGPLPVVGLIVKPADELRLELLFPEPRLAWRVNRDDESEQWLTLSGEIGGGEWAIERLNTGLADIVTYNDYRLVFGLHHFRPGQFDGAFEVGYAFARDLEYRSGEGNYSPPETFFLRWITRH